MKKWLFMIVLFMGSQLNFGQALGCAETILDNLQSCLVGNNIQYSFVYSGSNTIYVIGKGNPPPGKITSCIALYNTAANDCPEAPVLVSNPRLN
jgi:hypothetical protein